MTMKIVDSAKLQEDLSKYLDISRRETILVTKDNKPVAVLFGINGEELLKNLTEKMLEELQALPQPI